MIHSEHWTEPRFCLIFREDALDLGEIVRFRQSKHQQNARLLRIQGVGWDHSHPVIFVAGDHAAAPGSV